MVISNSFQAMRASTPSSHQTTATTITPIVVTNYQKDRHELIRQLNAYSYDFDLSNGAVDTLFVTCRFGPRKEVVFKIGPLTVMSLAITCCVAVWVRSNGSRY